MNYHQSAVIPFRYRGGHLEVMLITNNRRTRWVLPKGIVDDGESPAESAAREAFEEAGIRGRIFTEPIGQYTYEKWGGTCEVIVFLMSVAETRDTWQESHRTRRWLPPELAANLVDEPDLAAILRSTRAITEANRTDPSAGPA